MKTDSTAVKCANHGTTASTDPICCWKLFFVATSQGRMNALNAISSKTHISVHGWIHLNTTSWANYQSRLWNQCHPSCRISSTFAYTQMTVSCIIASTPREEELHRVWEALCKLMLASAVEYMKPVWTIRLKGAGQRYWRALKMQAQTCYRHACSTAQHSHFNTWPDYGSITLAFLYLTWKMEWAICLTVWSKRPLLRNYR